MSSIRWREPDAGPRSARPVARTPRTAPQLRVLELCREPALSVVEGFETCPRWGANISADLPQPQNRVNRGRWELAAELRRQPADGPGRYESDGCLSFSSRKWMSCWSSGRLAARLLERRSCSDRQCTERPLSLRSTTLRRSASSNEARPLFPLSSFPLKRFSLNNSKGIGSFLERFKRGHRFF